MKKLLIILLTLGLVACGGSDSTSSGTGDSGGNDSGDTGGGDTGGGDSNLPSASCSSALSGFSSDSDNDSFTSSGAITSITSTEDCDESILDRLNIFGLRSGNVVYNPTWSAENKEVFLDALASGEEEEAFPSCQVYLPEPSPGQDPSCFGPRLYFQHHLDGVSRGGPADGGEGGGTELIFNEDNISLNCDDNVCELPTGDLGIWSASDSEGEACSAAKMNSDVEYVSQFSDMGKAISALAECLVANETISRPEAGESVTITEAINTAVLNNGITFTGVVWSESSSAYTIALTTEASKFYVKTLQSEEDVYTTNIWGYFGDEGDDGDEEGKEPGEGESEGEEPGEGDGEETAELEGDGEGPSQVLAFSMYGTKDASNNQTVKFISAVFDNTPSDDSFDSTNYYMLKLDSDWNMDHRTIILNSPGNNTEDKLMKYSWIAGNGAPGGDEGGGETPPLLMQPDSYSRTFMAKINESSNTGVAYYGYGNSDNRLSITNFLCNWTGPGNYQAAEAGAGLAQKQILSYSSSSSFWEASDADSYIDYAPTRSCIDDNDDNGSVDTRIENEQSDGTTEGVSHVAGSAAFDYGLTESMGEARSLSAHELQDVSGTSDADYNAIDSIVDPTATSL